MSRIWKLPITLPENTEVNLDWNKIKIKWKLWELEFTHSPKIEVKKEDNSLVVVEPKDKELNPLWGTTRAILANMVEWVTNWYKKWLQINWVWYKIDIAGDKLILSIWYSHKVEMKVPAWLKVTADEKDKSIIYVTWIDKQLVWQFSSQIRWMKRPEPYKWKWIKYLDEQIRRKAWKTWAK